jgi:two-component system, cell cycle sensor histidine kinase and response regulator CckA
MSEEAVVVMDVRGIVLSVNPAFERITGRTRADTIGVKATFLAPGTCGTSATFCLTTPAEPLEGSRPDGTPYTAAVSVAPVTDGRGAVIGWVATLRDETQRLALEAQFHQAQKLEAMGRLAAGIAHDFNNQLTIITGYSDMASAKLPTGDPARGHIDHIRKAADRSAALTSRLLGLSRKHTVQPAPVALNVVLADITKPLSRVIGEDVRLTVTCAPDVGTVNLDRSLFEQAIMNLVINARDAMPNGGRIEITTANVDVGETEQGRSEAPPAGAYVRLAVADTGAGMDPQTMARIFDPFFTTKAEGKGTGLGLAMVYGFIKQSRGYIYVESDPGKGTRFALYFRRSRQAEPAAAVVPAEIPCGSCTENVLVLEDDESLRAMATQMLHDHGYCVLAASTGAEALALARRHWAHIDLLVTDVLMRDMSGPALVEQFRKIHPETRVLYVSGHARSTMVEHGVGLKDVNLLTKPFDLRKLAAKVRSVLDDDPPETPHNVLQPGARSAWAEIGGDPATVA